MKLNFWQWIGVALLVIGGSLFIYKHTSQKAGDEPTVIGSPSTQTTPATSAPATSAPASKAS